MNGFDVFTVITVLVGGMFVGSLLVTGQSTSTVIQVSTYPAGTIDGNLTVIGYNLTVSAGGHTTTMQVLCPLYPVGSRVPEAYVAFFFIFPVFTASDGLPKGC